MDIHQQMQQHHMAEVAEAEEQEHIAFLLLLQDDPGMRAPLAPDYASIRDPQKPTEQRHI